ncbi:caspase domain-containing protein [Bacteroidota bacterium]
MRSPTPFIICILLIISSITLSGQDNYATTSAQRVALVIGNSQYDTGPLLNPGNDARAMAIALRNTGFEVMEYIDLENQADMKKAIREFGRKIQNGGVGLFYYAGHGIQVGGKNYLIPTKAEIYAEEEVEYESVDVGFVLSQMEIARNRMNILILDACRNNPFARSWRSSATGLAFINAPAGTLIAYSTAPGSVASDGTGSNGLYTEELLKQIHRKGLKIEDVFKNVRSEVLDKSSNMQTPWESSSLVGDFYFLRQDNEISVTETKAEEVIPDFRGSTDKVEYSMSSANVYFFFRNGTEISKNTTAVTVDKDILLYDIGANRNYLLEDFLQKVDNNTYPPVELFSKSNAFWKIDEKFAYWFYIEGKDITTNVKHAYYYNSLVIFDPQERKFYLMNDFRSVEPGKLFPAISVFSDNNTLWWSDEDYYYLCVDGNAIASRTWTGWAGNDLIVHDEESSTSFLFRDYYNSKDKKLRPAEILFSPGLITCTRSNENKYFLYKNKLPYIMTAGAAYSEQDMIVYDTIFHQNIVFEGFLNAPTDTHIVGKPIYSKTDAIWKRKDNIYYLYIKGVLQVDDMVSARYSLNNSDMEVHQAATGTTWLLRDYGNRNDNILRPAEIKQ